MITSILCGVTGVSFIICLKKLYDMHKELNETRMELKVAKHYVKRRNRTISEYEKVCVEYMIRIKQMEEQLEDTSQKLRELNIEE